MIDKMIERLPCGPMLEKLQSFAVTPTGDLLYLGLKTINFIEVQNDASNNNKKEEIDQNVKTKLLYATQHLLKIDCDPVWQVDGRREFATLMEDYSVLVWDLDKGYVKCGHKQHVNHNQEKMVRFSQYSHHSKENIMMSYMKNRNILSMDSNEIIVYCVVSNTTYTIPKFISTRNHVLTILRCSPYDENLFAVGTLRGLVLICDLKKKLIVYTLKGHETSITSLSWNCIKIKLSKKVIDSLRKLEEGCENNVIDSSNDKKISANELNKNSKKENEQPKKEFENQSQQQENDEIFDIYGYECLDVFGIPSVEKPEQTICEENAGNDFIGIEKPHPDFDFKEACQNLKADIENKNLPETQYTSGDDNPVTLEDCSEAIEKYRNHSVSCGSQEGSIELLECKSRESQILEQEDVAEKEECLFEEDILLASGSTDGTFFIWNTVEGGSCDKLRPQAPNKSKTKGKITVVWASSHELLISNRDMKLSYWTLNENQKSASQLKRTYKFTKQKHDFTRSSVTYFGFCPHTNRLWYSTPEREIICENFRNKKILLKYMQTATNIESIRECPDDMNKIALAFPDLRIGILDLSTLSNNNVNIDNYYSHITAAVLTLAWSTDGKLLAFGSREGRVGYINVEKQNNATYMFNLACGKPIYSLDWDDYYLLAICNQKLYAYETGKKDGYVIDGVARPVSAVCARHNRVFVGTNKGNVQVYRKLYHEERRLSLELLQQVSISEHYINEITWSLIAPEQFAAVANDNQLKVYRYVVDREELICLCSLTTSNPRVGNASVRWSNREPNLLVTSGLDGQVIVWDLNANKDDEKQTFCKKFNGPISCAIFLPTDENYLLCSGKSIALEFIDMREKQTDNLIRNPLGLVQWSTRMQIDNGPNKKKKKPSILAKTAETIDIEAKLMDLAIKDDLIKDNKVEVEDAKKNAVPPSLPSPVINSNRDHKKESYMQISSTALYLTQKQMNKDPIGLVQSFMDSETPKTFNSSFLCAQLFGTAEQAKELLATELQNNKDSNANIISTLMLPQVTCELKAEILKCIQKKELTQWHVSLAPSISYSFWRNCCLAFAEQLKEQNRILQAATYLLSLHKQSETIDLLMDKMFYKEALLIARIYMQASDHYDTLASSIVEKWIANLLENGNLASATLICVLSGQLERAHEILSKMRVKTPEVETLLQRLKVNSKIVTDAGD